MASLWRAPWTRSWRVPLCVLAPHWKETGLHTMPVQNRGPFKRNTSVQAARGAAGWPAGKLRRRSAGGLPSTPSHIWHALLGTYRWPYHVWTSSSLVYLLFLLKVCAWEKGKHVVLLPQNILLSACSLQVWDFGSSTFNGGTIIPSCWSACAPGNQDCSYMLRWHTLAIFARKTPSFCLRSSANEQKLPNFRRLGDSLKLPSPCSLPVWSLTSWWRETLLSSCFAWSCCQLKGTCISGAVVPHHSQGSGDQARGTSHMCIAVHPKPG